ncbi:MAG: hypothetical protein HFJ25_00505 [Clostridia bacterium]|jgi:hypothetical protein|nr:hypothetical protein [Clostridia bacterium]
MEEKKKFILAIPTIVIIVVVIIGIFMIFYKRNVKDMSREDVRILAQKVATINNISCEIVSESNDISKEKSVTDYKLKDRKLACKTDYYTIFDDENENTKIQIDENEKVAYVYKEYKSEIMSFQEMLCTAEKLLESNEYEYKFLKYETMNGIKCVSFSLFNSDSTFDIWLDKSTGMIVKMECHYHMEGVQKIDTAMYYRYQIGVVLDDDVKKPDLTDYSIIDL